MLLISTLYLGHPTLILIFRKHSLQISNTECNSDEEVSLNSDLENYPFRDPYILHLVNFPDGLFTFNNKP